MLKSEPAEKYKIEEWQESRNRDEQTRLRDSDFRIIHQPKTELFASTFALEPSRFESLFNTNYSPFDSEVEELKNIIHGPLQELSLVEGEIARLESILAGLKSKRDTITTYIENHRALLSPSRRLSPEILSEIFVCCLPSNHLPTRSTAEAPLVLLCICKEWRQIALSTPRLWCSLHVYVPNYLSNAPVINRKLSGVEEWLKRSGELPITLSIFCPRNTSQYTLDEENSGRATPVGVAAIDVFIGQLAEKYSHRLKRLDLTLPLNAMSIIMSLKPVDIPILESLSITHSAFHDEYGLNDIVDFIKKTPTLRELKLNHHALLLEQFISSLVTDNTLNGQSNTGSFNVENLTNLTIKPRWGQQLPPNVLEILRKAVNLRSCTLHMVVPSSNITSVSSFGSTITEARITYPFLHTLDLNIAHDSIEAVSGAPLMPVFSRIDAPNLEHLSVHTPNFLVAEDCIPFSHMLTPKVKSIHFLIQMTAEAWIHCLLRVPKLTHLAGQCCESDYSPASPHTNKWEKVLRLLQGDHGSTGNDTDVVDILCPELEDINFSLVQDFGVRQLIELVDTRQRMALTYDQSNDTDSANNKAYSRRVKKLSSVAAYLGFHERLTKSDLDEIGRLRVGGTNIYLRIPATPLPADTPWYGLPGVSLLDGRELKWSWPDEHSMDFAVERTVYSTSGSKGEVVTRPQVIVYR